MRSIFLILLCFMGLSSITMAAETTTLSEIELQTKEESIPNPWPKNETVIHQNCFGNAWIDLTGKQLFYARELLGHERLIIVKDREKIFSTRILPLPVSDDWLNQLELEGEEKQAIILAVNDKVNTEDVVGLLQSNQVSVTKVIPQQGERIDVLLKLESGELYIVYRKSSKNRYLGLEGEFVGYHLLSF